MKKLIAILIAVAMVGLSACNCRIIDTKHQFNKAIVKLPDGSVETFEIAKWTDYGGEQLQLETTDGRVLLVCSVNCVLER